ncbi:MAG: TetR family transcriptional regulator [Firmicutes bacterium GWF2_51_9]|nr:MAG: TetR family transcriptional regulator [Firmicutes bacterium GWF2_51_9]OGS57589.1 MAG: TetR family transcriptional regulator [Firmicutes bacterium GWE2_51_13]HAM62177.1 TetR/AcrR family transcriptional regulator [Erysipelotrichaceae bacterium]HBZ40863.1 TetR/AcrR family transcriptional regulator [Erysipelotrichaceae bacterium]
MLKQKEITNLTRQNLIDAFWSLYRVRRIESITIKEITQKAGYNRGTFYEYFTDVYDVLHQIEETLIPHLDELPPIQLSNQQLGMPLDLFLDLYEKNSQYYSILLGDNGDPAFATKLKNATKPILLEAFNRNSVYTDTELDYILEYILSAMIGIMSHWFTRNKDLPVTRLIELVHDLMGTHMIQRIQPTNPNEAIP